MTVPATNSGQMVVTVQSSNLQLAGADDVHLQLLAEPGGDGVVADDLRGEIWTLATPVSAGQKYYIKVTSTGSYGQVGAYGLELNFGSQSAAADPAAEHGGGATSPTRAAAASITRSRRRTTRPPPGGSVGVGLQNPGVSWATIGNLAGWAATYTTSAGGAAPIAGRPPTATGLADRQSPVIAAPIGAVPVVPAPAPRRGDHRWPASPAGPRLAARSRTTRWRTWGSSTARPPDHVGRTPRFARSRGNGRAAADRT